VLDVGVKQA